MADVQLTVAGQIYEGWKTVKVVRSIESIAGSFELEITDRWAGTGKPWPILEEQECTIMLLGQLALTGYVDKRSISYEKESRTFSVSGRDRAGALVDCSAVLDQLQFRQTPLADLAKKICDPFKIKVAMQTGQSPSLPPRDKLAANPGDKAHSVLEKACRMVGFLPISDGKGGVQLCRAGSERATSSLKEGVNILKASAEYDFTERYYKYVCLSQHAAKIPKKDTKASAKATAKANAAASRARGEAFDEEVTRKERVLVINPEDGADKAYADRRAQWEATVRAAKSETVKVTVQGWAQESGKLWPINALVNITAERLGVKGDMLITEVTYGMSDAAGRTTQMTLKRPDAFTPEPRIQRKAGGGGAWKEIAGGVKIK